MINTLIPTLIYVVIGVLGILMDSLVVFATIAGKTEKKDALIFLAGILMIFVGFLAAFNIPQSGPYFEELEQGKIYLTEDTFKYQDKYAVVLAEWSLVTKEIIPKSEIFNSLKDEPGFKAGECVSLQNKELKTIKVQGCGNNS